MPRYYADGFGPIVAHTDELAAKEIGTELARAEFGPEGTCRVRQRGGACNSRSIAYEVHLMDGEQAPFWKGRSANVSFVEVCANDG